MTEILLKVALNTITLTLTLNIAYVSMIFAHFPSKCVNNCTFNVNFQFNGVLLIPDLTFSHMFKKVVRLQSERVSIG